MMQEKYQRSITGTFGKLNCFKSVFKLFLNETEDKYKHRGNIIDIFTISVGLPYIN